MPVVPVGFVALGVDPRRTWQTWRRTAPPTRREELVPIDNVLEVRDVSHRFGTRQVLDHVDLHVPRGRVIGLLGPNGAGKTTLMRIVFGVIDPDEGEVVWQGRPARATDRSRWGYMPQERGLYRDMRVLDQSVWIAELHGMARSEARERAMDLLTRLGLDDRARDTVAKLSGGMAQRVQLAAAMVHGPELLVLDEPFSGLDPTAVEFLSDVVQDHVRAGGALVFSSHQLDLVEGLCETITLVDHGRVVLHGDVQDLKRSSPDRHLRVDAHVEPRWIAGAPATVSSHDHRGTRVHLDPGADALAVLDLIRAHAVVTDVAVELPTLSELFLAAVGRDRVEDDDTDDDTDGDTDGGATHATTDRRRDRSSVTGGSS